MQKGLPIRKEILKTRFNFAIHSDILLNNAVKVPEIEANDLAKLKPETEECEPSIHSQCNGDALSEISSISSFTNSVGTNELLSPLSSSPNSSFMSDKPFNTLLPQTSVKELVKKTVDVTWDQLFERIFGIVVPPPKPKEESLKSPAEVLRSLKIMEVFPQKAKTTLPKAQESILKSPVLIQTLSQVEESVKEESSINGDLSLCSSTSSTSSSTSTPSTTKSVTSPALVSKSNSSSKTASLTSDNIKSTENSYSSDFDTPSETITATTTSKTLTPAVDSSSSKEISVKERVGQIMKDFGTSSGILF